MLKGVLAGPSRCYGAKVKGRRGNLTVKVLSPQDGHKDAGQTDCYQPEPLQRPDALLLR